MRLIDSPLGVWITLTFPAWDAGLLLLESLLESPKLQSNGKPISKSAPLQFWMQDLLIGTVAYGGILGVCGVDTAVAAAIVVALAALLVIDSRAGFAESTGSRAVLLLIAILLLLWSPLLACAAWYLWHRLRHGVFLPKNCEYRAAGLLIFAVYGLAFLLPLDREYSGWDCYAAALDEFQRLPRTTRSFETCQIGLSWLANPLLWLSVYSMVERRWNRASFLGLLATILAGQLLIFEWAPAYDVWLLSMALCIFLPVRGALRERRQRTERGIAAQRSPNAASDLPAHH